MRLQSSFLIDRAVEEVRDALLDLEQAARCVPGARIVRAAGGGNVEGELALRIGPLAATYAGSAQLRDIQREQNTFALRARGRELSGMGAADALVRVRLSADDGSTRVDLDADLSIRGKVAEHGRGVIGEVAERLTGQFARNLEQLLAERAAKPVEPAGAAASEAAAPSTGAGAPSVPSGSGAAAAGTWFRIAVPIAAAAVSGYAAARLAARRR